MNVLPSYGQTSPEARHSLVGRVLIADDDGPFRESTAQLMRAAGFSCVTVDSAEQARVHLSGRDIDLIVADIRMPGNENLEMLGGLSEDVPIVLVTGQPTLETATRAVEAKVVGYLIKPFEIGRLIETARKEIRARAIRRFIQQRRRRAEELWEQMKVLEEATLTRTCGSSEQELQAYLAMFSESVVAGLRDWGDFVGTAAAVESGGGRQRLVDARPFQLTQVLRDVVQVLERTKTQFKSKDLAELRHRLETVLSGAGARPSPPL